VTDESAFSPHRVENIISYDKSLREFTNPKYSDTGKEPKHAKFQLIWLNDTKVRQYKI